jgi:hypothetical protein
LVKASAPGDISRSQIADAVDAGLQGVAAAIAERVGEPPIGAAAGEREADDHGRADAIIHTGSEAEGIRSDII